MICRDEAIVLDVRDFRETSKIAVFFTKQHGKMSGLFKGIRAEPKKFASNLDFLSLNEIIFYKKRFSELHLVSQCDLKKSFDYFKKDILAFAIGGFCSELINATTQAEDAHPELFDLLLDALSSLDNKASLYALLYNFTVKALALSGFQPHLESCVACRSSIIKGASFSNRLGGLLCEKCFQHDGQRENILGGTIATILFFQRQAWPDSLRLRVLPTVEEQLNRIIFSFLDFNLGRKFKSLAVLEEIKKGAYSSQCRKVQNFPNC